MVHSNSGAIDRGLVVPLPLLDNRRAGAIVVDLAVLASVMVAHLMEGSRGGVQETEERSSRD